MATATISPTSNSFDFETSYTSARAKVLAMDPEAESRLMWNRNEQEFKDSFSFIFTRYIEGASTGSVKEQVRQNLGLELILTPLLERYIQDNILVTRADLATYLRIIEWLREIWETIVNP